MMMTALTRSSAIIFDKPSEIGPVHFGIIMKEDEEEMEQFLLAK